MGVLLISYKVLLRCSGTWAPPTLGVIPARQNLWVCLLQLLCTMYHINWRKRRERE